ncbi:MAG: sporulation integral membrane protein YtvI [Clostridia bacterium]|nr:sporulation integral membrane protein YtvI [Clostridia bacterium]
MNILPKDPSKTLIKITYVAVVLALIYFVLPRAVALAMPFIVAYVISRLIIPIAGYLESRLKFPRRLAIILVMLIAVGLLALLIFTLFYQTVYELQHFAYIIPALLEGEYTLPEWVNTLINNLKNFYITMPASMQEFIVMVTNNLRGNIYNILEPATQAVISAAARVGKALPNIFIFAIVMLLSTYFMCDDRDRIRSFLKGIVPKSTLRRAVYIKNDLIKACGGYLKAQGILMCITFIVMLIGLTIIGVESAALVAFVIAVIDVIPVLGTGTVLIPWAVISLITGKYFFAIGLIIIYAIAFLIRHLSEPKIVSQQIGLHPLITLFAVYIGLKTIGVFGMVLGPIVAIIIINFFKAEQKYKEEFEG